MSGAAAPYRYASLALGEQRGEEAPVEQPKAVGDAFAPSWLEWSLVLLVLALLALLTVACESLLTGAAQQPTSAQLCGAEAGHCLLSHSDSSPQAQQPLVSATDVAHSRSLRSSEPSSPISPSALSGSLPSNLSSPCFCCNPSTYPLPVPAPVSDHCRTPYPMTPYSPPSLPPSALVIGLLSMDKYALRRSEVAMQTWLNPVRVPYGYFTCSIPRPPSLLQPCVRIPHTDDSFLSNVNKTLLGLRELYRLHSNASWYYLTGDDDYVNPHYLLRKLDAFDSSEPHFIGGNFLPPISCANTGATVSVASGGPGLVVSNGLMQRTAHLMEPWLLNDWHPEGPGRGRDAGDVALSCFFAEQHQPATRLPGFAWSHPRDTADEGLVQASHADFHEERTNWHYVTRETMLEGDVFFALQMVDRMQRHGQLELLAQYARQMVLERFHQQKRNLDLLDTLRSEAE